MVGKAQGAKVLTECFCSIGGGFGGTIAEVGMGMKVGEYHYRMSDV